MKYSVMLLGNFSCMDWSVIPNNFTKFSIGPYVTAVIHIFFSNDHAIGQQPYVQYSTPITCQLHRTIFPIHCIARSLLFKWKLSFIEVVCKFYEILESLCINTCDKLNSWQKAQHGNEPSDPVI